MSNEVKKQKEHSGSQTDVTETTPLPSFSFYAISLIVLSVSIFYIYITKNEPARCIINPTNNQNASSKTYWVYGRNLESGYLHNVFTVLEGFGYERVQNNTNWDLLWAHDYPFRTLLNQLRHLKAHQKINHFPGCGYLTNKVDLATSGLRFIPPAFKLPQDKEKLTNYIAENPESTFVEKNNDHRNVIFRKTSDLDALDSNSTFIQEFIAKPLLVDGYKFDIGIYTIITSIDPLRIYIYNGDAILRFCPVTYYPFNASNLDKYVIGDDYLPIWKVPSLKYHYNDLGFSMKESLNAYLRVKGENPDTIWEQIEEALRSVILAKESDILNIVNRFKSKRNFFEMMRFDFIVDEKLNVFLLEANMSPNLSSAHFPPNRLLYQQVLLNVLALVGVGKRLDNRLDDTIASDKNIAVYPEQCASEVCKTDCVSPVCQLCKTCLSSYTRRNLKEAIREHRDLGDCKRIFPPSQSKQTLMETNLEHYTAENYLQYRWYQGKCLLDASWC